MKPRSWVLLGVLAALLLAAGTFFQQTEPAAAQGASIPNLVSNLDQTQSSVPGNLASDRAQGFTTGGDSAGYTLTSVDQRRLPVQSSVPCHDLFLGIDRRNPDRFRQCARHPD